MDNKEQTLQILSNATGKNTELLNIKVSPGVGDIVVQLDVFNDQNTKSKTIRQFSTESINLNSHQEVFQKVLQQVTNTSNERTFLKILQHLLHIDLNDATICDVTWKVIEKLVHRATQLESSEEAGQLIKSSVAYKFSCKNCQGKENATGNKTERKEVSPSPSSLPTKLSSYPNSPPVPSFPPLPPTAPGLPPPPPPPLNGKGPPLPPPNQLAHSNNLLLPPQIAPKASKKLKTFNWTKIPPHKIINKLNIWTIMANDRQYKCVELIDFKGIEGLFALQTANKGNDVVDGATPPIKKEPKHIHLLDAQHSLKINIFLSQFKGYSSEDIAELIRIGDCKIINLERLKDLKKFFENEEEITLLKNFVGDRQRLASAEKFLISLLEVSNFKLRIDSMILKEEFQLNITYLEPCLNDIIQAGNNLMKNKTLQEILSIIIIIGNFLNSGGYAGNAAGIKLSSLTKLTEIKANKSGMHLLHLIALEVQRYNPELLDLSNELSFLENVSKINNDQIEKDVKDLELALDSNKKEIYSPTTDKDMKQQMIEFIKKAEDKMEMLKKLTSELKSLRVAMADFFCEDLTTFKVDECFEIFYKLCEQFKQALKENKKRQQLEIQESLRRKQKEEQLAQKALTGSTIEVESPTHMPPKRLCLPSSKEYIKANNKNLVMNSKKTEDDLMEFLENSNRKRNRERETHRKTRLDKKPDLLKFNFERERNQHYSNSVESSNENIPTSCVNIFRTPEDQRKTLLIKKSWKRLMEGYTASHLRDNCLTPDITPKRESLQICIRSNSTVDSISGEPNKQPSETQASHQAELNSYQSKNFIEKNLKAGSPLYLDISKDRQSNCETGKSFSSEEPVIGIRPPRLKLKTMASIVQLGCRYSSINEEDLKSTIKKLRTPTLEKSQFCFSPTTLKSNNWIYEQSPLVLKSVDEENTNQDLYEDLENNRMELQQPNVCLKAEEPSLQTITAENCSIAGESENSEIDCSSSKENCEAVLAIENKNYQIIDDINNRQNSSKRLVTKLQCKVRDSSTLQTQQRTSDKHVITLHNECSKDPLFESENLRKNNVTIDENSKDKPLNIVPAPSIETKTEKTAIVKKSFVGRLQSKIKALSPLKSQHEQLANFQSYVNFDSIHNTSSMVKSNKFIKLETNPQKQEVVKTHRKICIAKESTPKEQILVSSKDIKNQLKLPPP